MDVRILPDAAAWAAMWAPTVPLAEIALRGSAIYLGLFAILRITRRETGGLSLADVLLVTLLGDAAQNAMAGDATSIGDGILLMAVIIGWERAIDWAGWRHPRLRRLLHPGPLPLVRDGRIIRRNLAREWITRDELMSQLRQAGVDDVSRVALATLEPDGSISVIRAGDG